MRINKLKKGRTDYNAECCIVVLHSMFVEHMGKAHLLKVQVTYQP